MNRLTKDGASYCEDCVHGECDPTCKKCDDKIAMYNRLREYEDTGLMPEEAEACKAAMMGQTLARIIEIEGLSVDRMKELAKAEAEGRLIELPCKVGDTVYAIKTIYSFIDGTRRREIVEGKAYGIILGEDMQPLVSFESDSMGYMPAQPGSALYFSRDEAEAARSVLQAVKKIK